MLCVIPVALTEIARARALLSWIDDLDPSLPNHRYLIVASSQVPIEDAKELNAMAARLFADGTVIKQRETIESGWPMSANAMFRLAAKWIFDKNLAPFFLWLESDAIPMRSGWLDALESEYRRAGKPFCGTIYPHPVKHFNGVMIYPRNIRPYNEPMLNAHSKAWDLMRPDLTVRHGFETPLIQRLLSDPRTSTPMSFPDRQSVSVIRSECVLFHGCKDGSLVARLRERNNVVAAPKKPHPVPKLLKKTNLVVVLPFCNKDATVALSTLEWILELNQGRKHANDIVLSYDLSTPAVTVDKISRTARQAFKRVISTSYESPLPGQLPQTIAFRHAAQFMASEVKKSWIWLEPDMIPIRAGWLEVLQDEYRGCSKQFMGSIVAGKGHCNGTAIYPANAAEYICDALRMTWTAWDTAMKREMIEHCHDASHLMQHVWGVANGKFHPFGGTAPTFSDASLLNQIDPRAVVFHRNKDLSLPAAIRKHGLSVLKPLELANQNTPGTEIMIVSYHKDVQWLKYCLASIKKFASDFSGVTILIPTADLPVFDWVGKEHPDMLLLDYHTPTDKRLWHVAHQLQKFKADEWCPNADFICHVDSDCIFTEPVTPDFYFVDGKPVLWIEEFTRTGGPWKGPTERALGMPVIYDTMRHHPAVHYRELYAETRAIIEKVHRVPIDKYVLSCPIEHKKMTNSWNLSEFECLGNVALLPTWKDRYHFIDLGLVPRPVERLRQFWSLGRPDAEQTMPSTQNRCVPLEVIRKALA